MNAPIVLEFYAEVGVVLHTVTVYTWIMCLTLKTGYAMKMMFGLLTGDWRYVWMGSGAQCVVKDGTTEMLKSFVANCSSMGVSSKVSVCHIATAWLSIISILSCDKPQL